MRIRKYICPKCTMKTGVDIVYGYPTENDFEIEQRGDIVLGGCCIPMDPPDRQCTSCGHKWQIKRRGHHG